MEQSALTFQDFETYDDYLDHLEDESELANENYLEGLMTVAPHQTC